MRFRPHNSLFTDAITKLTEVDPPTLDSLTKVIKDSYKPIKLPFEPNELVIENTGYDERQPWEAETFIVHIPAATALKNIRAGKMKTTGVLGYVDKLPDDYVSNGRGDV